MLRVGRRYKGRYGRRYRIDLSKFRYCIKNTKRIPTGINDLSIIIGKIIVVIGLLLIFKNTMIYSGAGISRGMTVGTSCGVAFILLMIGIIITLFNKNSFIGWALISIGVLLFFIGIIINLKMMFMPTNLLKAVMLFGIVALGIALIIKGALGNFR